ncbi:MAG: hypothetical protein RMI45_02925 [Ignisphaera sp.]|nr:hypothetical protein [Ignisphaera sp.]MDW8085178.1 hypothetical protein [Ignisphaera sp.]
MNRLFAIVILVGVAIALTAAGVAWFTTTYHSMMWKPEVLRIHRVEIHRDESGVWKLHIEMLNEGDAAAEIYRIEIHGVEEVRLNPPKRVEPGQPATIDIELSREYSYGTMYTIRLYLKSGTLYPVLERVVRA